MLAVTAVEVLVVLGIIVAALAIVYLIKRGL